MGPGNEFADGSPKSYFTGGFDISAGDVNGDLKTEIITSAGFGGGPHIRIFSPEGKLISQFFAYDQNFKGGVNVLTADFNKDGKEEILTLPMQFGGPHLKVFNQKAELLYQSFVMPEDTKSKLYFSFDELGNKLILDSANEVKDLKLAVPIYYQEKLLSCEAASLRMALNFKGFSLSENDILKKIPIAYPIKYSNGIWADPNEGYVGDVNGSQKTKTGYGVYWQPISLAANDWGSAESFTNWTFNKLIEQLMINNPVIIWGSFKSNPLDISWHTPTNKYIKAYQGEHTYVVSGFIGSPLSPEKVIVIDSIAGKTELTKNQFLEKWALFDNSGVVVK